jgi:mono/diheme cytochrome c family protein
MPQRPESVRHPLVTRRTALQAVSIGLMRLTLLLAVLALRPAALAAANPVDYSRDVQPLLRERCVACHGPLKHKGGLRLDAGSLVRRGGKHGPAVLPGKSAASLLVARVADPDEATRMPPEGAALTAAQVELLRAWIDNGAASPADEKPEPDPRDHWAFRVPQRPPLPAAGTGGRNPIDAFLAAERAKHEVVPASPADKATLLRRVYLDLIGLPPTREELHAFLADSAGDAYEKVVDRLLASPQYGERWARHWMDVWRYSDWYGRRSVPDVMNSYPRIWRWRDWIVRSLNEDKGYDRMVVEMLAADEVAPEDDASVVATGFLVRNWFKWNYNTWMKDTAAAGAGAGQQRVHLAAGPAAGPQAVGPAGAGRRNLLRPGRLRAGAGPAGLGGRAGRGGCLPRPPGSAVHRGRWSPAFRRSSAAQIA